MLTRGSSTAIFRPVHVALAALAAACATVLLTFAAPSAEAVPTCTRYWTGTSSSAWGVMGNWSATDGGGAATVPTGTDFVCISTATANPLAIVTDYREVAGISFPDSATVHPNVRVSGGGTLRVGTGAPNSYDSVIHNLTLQSSSAFGGTADVTAGTIGSLSGVILGGGTGSLTLAPGGVASTATGTQVQLSDGYRLINSGAFTSNNGQVQFNDGTVTNHGTWTFKNTSIEALYNPGSGASHSFTNASDGTTNITLPLAADAMVLQYLPIINNGTLAVTKGHLDTRVGGTGTGTYTLATATSLELNGGIFDISGATVTSAGTGVLNLNGGGSLTGSPTALSNLTLNGGALVGGGTITLPSATTTTITTVGVHVDDSTDLVNNGTVNQNNGSIQFNDGTVTNHGTWTFKNTSIEALYNPGSGASHSFTNASDGTTNITLPLAADAMVLQYLPIINNGTLAVTKGHLDTRVGGTGTGTYTLATATSLELNGGIFDISGATVTSAGTGVLSLNGGGSLTGSPSTGNLTFNGGALVGGGTITLPSATTTTITTGGVHVDESTDLVNNGTVTQNNGTVQFNDGTVTNHGTWTFKNHFNEALYNPGSGASHSFTNAADGTTNITLPLATDTMVLQYLPIINNGTLAVTKGHLDTRVGGIGTGTYTLATATSLELNGGTFDISGATVTSAGTGVLSLNGGGSLTGSPSTGNLTFNGGHLVGGGTITLPSATTTTITTGGVHVDESTDLVNNGTVNQNNGTVQFNDGTVTNHGTWTFKNTSVEALYNPGSGASHSFTNAADGTTNITLPAPGDTMIMQYLPIINNGALAVTQGHLDTRVGGIGTGTYTLASSTSIELNGGTFDITGATVNGPGILNFNSAGLISGTGTATNVAFNGGGLIGAGTLTLASTGTSSIPAGSSLTMSNTSKLLNQGTLTQSGPILLNNDPNVENAGTWNLAMSGSAASNQDAVAKDPWVNSATGLLTGSPGASNTVDLGPILLTNSGEVRTLSGTTNLSLTNLSAGGLLNGGTLTTQGGTLGVNANIVTNSATVTVVSGAILNSSTLANALPSLRTNNGSLTLSQSVTGTGAVTNTGAVWLKGGTFRPTTYTQSGGSTRVDPGAVLKGGAAGTGAITINGGNLTGGGSVQGPVSNSGIVQPGAAGNPLSVTGTFTQLGGGIFGATVNGTTTVGTDYSQLAASGAATLGGTLAVTTGPGVNPPLGTTVRILNASSRTGTFATVTGVDTLPAGKYWRVAYDATGVSLVVMPDPVASVGNVSVTEGNAGTVSMSFPVTLDVASDRTVSYAYSTVAQTASAVSDFVAASGTVTFTPSVTSQNVSVTVNGDATFEPDETLLLRLSSPVNGSIGTNDGVGTILNDDPEPPAITVTSVSPSTLGQGAAGIAMTVSGSGFDPTSNITFSKAGVVKVAGTQQFVDVNTMTVTVSVSGSTPVGPTNVTVTGANGTATCTGCLTISAKPVVTSADPGFLGAGAAKREVTITGSGFAPGAVARINNVTVASTSYINANTLEIVATVPYDRVPGNFTITVTNPDNGRGTCSCFATVAGPTVTSMSQTSFARGTTVNVTINGTNFGPGVKLIGPSGVVFDSVVRVNATTVTATASTASNAALGVNRTLTVVNPRSSGYGSILYKQLSVTT